MNEDFLDLLRCLLETGARFLIVGAHALVVHGIPRATGDLYVWVDRTPTNVERVWSALLNFGAPVAAPGVGPGDLEAPGMTVQIGLPPRRIDLMTEMTGVLFDEAWPSRISLRVDTLDVPFIGRQELVRNKRAAGRPKDLADLHALGERK